MPGPVGRKVIRKTLVMRIVRHGCTNRPFNHIVLTEKHRQRKGLVIEQLGTFDPMPNAFGEKMVAVNFERVMYWMKQGAELSGAMERLLGNNCLETQ